MRQSCVLLKNAVFFGGTTHPLASRFHEAWCPTGCQTNEK